VRKTLKKRGPKKIHFSCWQNKQSPTNNKNLIGGFSFFGPVSLYTHGDDEYCVGLRVNIPLLPPPL
jgi:hypothetical protein